MINSGEKYVNWDFLTLYQLMNKTFLDRKKLC